MTKADLAEEVARVVEISHRKGAAVVETVLESILQAVREGSPVQIRRFGTFAIRQRGGRVGRNPKTGSQVQVSPQARSLFQAKHRAAGVDQQAPCEPWRQGVAAKSVVFIVPFIPAATSILLSASVVL